MLDSYAVEILLLFEYAEHIEPNRIIAVMVPEVMNLKILFDT